jgi:hypothetical protein
MFVLHLQISSVSMQTPELSGRKHSEETNSSAVSSLVGNMHGTEPAMKKQRQDNRRRIWYFVAVIWTSKCSTMLWQVQFSANNVFSFYGYVQEIHLGLEM